MNFLLDTHALIWFLNGDEKLSLKIKESIEDTDNTKIVSIASILEIAIKISIGKFKFPGGFKNLLKMIDDNGFAILAISFEHAIILSYLEFLHRDPFDRILISQCKSENIAIATIDENIKRYNIKAIW